MNRSEWYSFNPISSVTTLGTSGSDTASTLGGLDQSCADFVLMASPIRGQSLHPPTADGRQSVLDALHQVLHLGVIA